MKPMQQTEIKDQKETKEDLKGRVYELGYLLVPTFSEEEVPAVERTHFFFWGYDYFR
jgi:C-terminal processing protease CtpA/Prc